MRITLTDAGKRFNRDWIFRHLHYEFIAGRSYAITGPNGSGKSTLLQAIAGAMTISEGNVQYELSGSDAAPIPVDQAFRFISLAAPYLEVIEEMTLSEFLFFHQSFKPFLPGFGPGPIISLLGLDESAAKQIRYFSSGMRQRVKLAQAIFSDTPAVLLDEPCTNLDEDGIVLYRRLVTEHCSDRLLIISSNDRQEYDFCEEILNISGYKTASSC
ncbi:MAG: ATP-binding cassette domain-containing protein [Bacteroidota bacterium]|nr:ATP-binding cassette domain-containing protein [Bacteroidota bacterium]MDP4215401.1 ATP-binding cassette domain-containing protein [Bacteroidota bacterium]MDP4246633.1 ATP-binding cassette domain-containing protein [Bacteroidota bacterium]MDP4254221.1 ATP-binding cassette domain-containing protein [Bacteroidota bacterium]MDP4256756.1 ATP-binding cassette domain-containing protein [Bacteroidota bacterium]